jgi:hypothetical protein
MVAIKEIDETELKVNAIEALNKALGPLNAYKFLSSVSKDKTDYVKISRKIFEGMKVDEICKLGQIAWEKRHSKNKK